MSKAHPFDLNYGHLGEPNYDSESQKWSFARQHGITQRLLPFGQPIVALEASRQLNLNSVQDAIKRSQNLRDLTDQYSELLPSINLLPGLAQTSEAVIDVTSNYDPTTSELLAFGQAIVVQKERRGAGKVPIAAVAGGTAGEAVRIVLLSKEQLEWKDSNNVTLSNYTSKHGEQVWWVGNGRSIEQLVFADVEDESRPWLAVRYGGTVSILQPLLRPDATTPKRTRSGFLSYPSSWLDPNHLATLPVQRSGGVPIADVTFNPWNNKQIATVDQCGRWFTWDIELRAQKMGVWMIRKSRNGSLSRMSGHVEPKVIADGWGAILWVSDMNTIVVSSRTMLAVYDIKDDSRELFVLNSLPNVETDWILDLKRSPSELNHVFVLTTSSVYWFHISTVREKDSPESEPGARCLLSWRHFRDPQDFSVRLSITQTSKTLGRGDDIATLIVLLYSLSSELTTVYNLEHSTTSAANAISASDPYILNFFNEEHLNVGTGVGKARPKSRISNMVLRAVPYDKSTQPTPSGSDQVYIENNICFYQLNILFKDLSLSESLYVDIKTSFDSIIHPPERRTNREVIKTPAKIADEFVVSDGVAYRDFGDPEKSIGQPGIHQRSELSQQDPSLETEGLDEDPWTISFEWLEKDVRGASLNPARTKHLDEILESICSEAEDILAIGNPMVETLLQLANTVVSVVDIDKASTDLTDFFRDLTNMVIDDENISDAQRRDSFFISSVLPLPIQRDLALEGQIQLAQVYDGLIKAWIVPLSLKVPGRARIALEKFVRDLAAQICLASHELRLESGRQDDEGPTDGKITNPNVQFALPVRRKVSASNLRKGKEPATRSSPPLASSQISEDVGFVPPPELATLPTHGPTSSLHSQNSVSSLAASEDPSSRRLQAYCSLAIQPSLPAKMSNLLIQWNTGGDPLNYDWEAAQQALLDDESEDQTQAKKRQRTEKRQKRQRQTTVGPSSQPPPKRLGGSQQQVQETQGSSQPTQALLTASQPEPGRFGGSLVKGRKKKFGSQGKRPGF